MFTAIFGKDSKIEQATRDFADSSRAMADREENLTVRRVLAELSEVMGDIILLAPKDEQAELSNFVLSQVALIVDFIREQGSTQH
jgi:hypothetical protein